MIDLSFLTEEEQEAIMKVLQRDAELKRNEEERVRHLPEKIQNDNQLKNMSGQWFYEAKSKRHRDKIHGADIIRASIRRKPTTKAERSQNKSDKTKNSWLNNVNKEVSVPAELSGIREETEEGEVKSNQSSNALDATLDKPQESSKKVAVSPGKQRKNPFNDVTAPEQNVKSRDSESGTTDLSQMSNEDTLSPSKESQSKRNVLNSRSEEHRQASGEQTDESQRIADQPPVPKARKVIYKITDPILEKDGSFPKPAKRTDWVSGAGTPPRGILKRSSSSSSTDSEVLRVNQIFDHQSKTGLPSSTVLERVAETNPPAEDPSQNSLERLKQVRFSSSIGTKQPLQSPQLHHGKDIGEFDLLESDYVKNAENDSSRLDALQNEQTLPVKSPRSQSSALDVNATDRDVSQEDTSAPYSSDANRSSLPVNETLQLKTSLPMEPVTPRKSSSNISPNVQDVQTVDETLSQNISKQSPNPDLESSKHTIDQQPLSAKTKSPQVPNASSADLQQGSEELDPILKALKRSADRQRPSKSLEDIPSATSNKGKVDIPKEELVLSAEDDQKTDQQQETNENVQGISTVPSDLDNQFSNPEKLKRLSQSVPAFLQEESDRDTDTTSESSYPHGRIKKSPSSLTNLSGSSGMASLSSVSGSVMSIYSGDFGNVDVKGHIQFAIDYVEQLKEFHIFVSQCKDLAIADVKKQHSDPYVKTYLLPEKYKLGKRKTSVKKKTLNPVYNEILRYKIDKALVKTQRLNLSVWHNDTFGRNSFLGEVELDLGTWDWNDKLNKQMNWFLLKPRTPAAALELENRGEIKLALQYVPQPVGGNKTLSTGEVHIWVKECNDLPLLRGNKINSFVKCTILPDTSRKSRQKTRAVAKTTSPVFNHTMVYDGFRADDLKEACVELTVWDHNKLANRFLGGLRIGMGTGKSYGTAVDWMDSTSDETTLWERMMSSPNTWVEDTLPLRMIMVAKLTK
ncbi:synaptotagmin-like protein 2 isoform X1 [Terrapene carolina triunguis]|uniref:synaptotagmin-like protein 2 isoform X1 n=2 Tax=Terrapene triunguis TaxID=2587831 RepID=UPI000CEFCCEC|nr:synaptotagmin-like protein 2 isoform X1 [Terrapene carolina triunguis]